MSGFVKRGGACKHIWAAVLHLNNLREQQTQLTWNSAPFICWGCSHATGLPVFQFACCQPNSWYTFACYTKLDQTSCHHSWRQVVRVIGCISSQYRELKCSTSGAPMTDIELDGMSDHKSIAMDVPDDKLNEFDITSLEGSIQRADHCIYILQVGRSCI